MDIAQILVNSLVRASELGLLAVGLTMVYGILKFPNIAHGDYAMLGGYLAFAIGPMLGLSLLWAVPLAAIAFGVLAVGMDWIVFRPLRRQGATVFTQLIASLGLALIVRNVVRMIWSNDMRTFDLPLLKPLRILGASIDLVEIGIIVTGVVFMILFHLGLHYTKLGKALRAISDDSELANSCAIDTEQMIRWLWFAACAYAAVGGFMLAVDHVLFPRLGFNILIPVFGAAIVGGVGNPYGAMLGALIIALAENIILGLNFGPLFDFGGLFEFGFLQLPTGYKPAISFIIIIVMLLFKPTGLMGKR